MRGRTQGAPSHLPEHAGKWCRASISPDYPQVARRGYHGVDFGPAGHEVHRDLPDDVLGLLVKAAAAVHLDAQLQG